MDVNDMPKALRDPKVREDKRGRISEAHVAPLNEWVLSLKEHLGPDAVVPWFDPDDGGVEARIACFYEAPGPKATVERGGSGFVSRNNDDQSAANVWRAMQEAGVDRRDTVQWNVVPYYLGNSAKIRAWNDDDVDANGHLLTEVFALLPEVSVVILSGKAAQTSWSRYAPAGLDVTIVNAPHPSPTNVNTRPGTYEAVVDAWRQANELMTDASGKRRNTVDPRGPQDGLEAG